MARAAAVALAVVAALAATTAHAATLDTSKPWLSPFANLTAQIKAAQTNSGTPKQRILNGTKPTTAILDALNAKRTVVQGDLQAALIAKINASAAATQAVDAFRNVSATKQAALIAKLNATEMQVEAAQAVLLAKLNGTKLASVVDYAFNKTKDKLEAAQNDVSFFAKLKAYKLRGLAPDPNLSEWVFSSDAGALASSFTVDQTTNGQVAPASADESPEYGLRVAPGGGRSGGAAPVDAETGDIPEAVADGDAADTDTAPAVTGTPSIQTIMSRQRMEAAAAADAAAADDITPADTSMDALDLDVVTWLASRPEDGAPADEITAWVEALPEGAVEPVPTTTREAVDDDTDAPFDGPADPAAFYAIAGGDEPSEGEERVIGVPDYVYGPGVAIPDIAAADVDAQKKYVALRALGVKRDLALDAVGATEGATFKAAFAYVLARLKYGSGVDLIFQGDAVGPTNTAAQGSARKRSLLSTAVDAGRKLLATATNPVLAFVGDTTKTTATYNGFTVEPPDQGLCAGGGWVIEATNVVISIRNQNAPATVAANFPKSLYNFYRGVSGDSYGDPRCVFIPGSNVFVVTSYNFNGAKSFVSVAVSPPVTSVAPNVATWKVYQIDSRGIGVLAKCTAQTPCIGDYPMLGFNDNSLWLSTNAFYKSGTSYYWAGVQLFGLSLSQLVAQVNNPYVWTAGRTDIFTLQPATKQTATGDAMMFLASYDATRVYALTVSTTSRLSSNLAPIVGTPGLITTGLRIASPPTVRQGNNVQVDGGDTRILSLAFANGRLYATCNTAATWSGVTRNSIAYFVINASARTMVYAGVYGSASWHAYGAAIAPSNTNSGVAGFVGFVTGSTSIPFASLFGKVTAGSGVTYATVVNAAPNGQYLKGFTAPVRTGDYSQACVDPGTGQFWGASEQGQTTGVTTYNNWGTIIWNALL